MILGLLLLYFNLFAVGKSRLTGSYHLVAVAEATENLVAVGKTLAEFYFNIAHCAIGLEYIHIANT